MKIPENSSLEVRFNEAKTDSNILFVKSSQTSTNKFYSTSEILRWIEVKNLEITVKVEQIKLKEIKNWTTQKNTNISHVSGKFFSIDGINVNTNWRDIHDWDQPIINQPEIGYLGFLTKIFDGVLYFLVQAKIEPGNVNKVQISPTLQATKSNYTQVHGGKKPPYLEYFQDRQNNEILLDQLQSEQGARFLKKRNRNIIIKVDAEVEVLSDFKWMTLGQIKDLLAFDNKVNMDTRTVISGIPYGSYDSNVVDIYKCMFDLSDSRVGINMLCSELDQTSGLFTIDNIISWITELKSYFDLNIKKIPLSEVRDWELNPYEFKHVDNKYFSVIGVNVEISNREVTSWQQPLIKPAQEGLCAFVIKEINGVYHFLVQAKLECGNHDTIELAPTVQCLTGNYLNEKSISNLPYLKYVLAAEGDKVLYDTIQSEEGGRFFEEQNRNMLVLADPSFELKTPNNYKWMTLNQIKSFIRFNNYINIQARSLISAIKFK